ncbi:uncharacterized protein [Nerophis lumbriciformis]|uniref:uncharacterized protein n=1 Tax=Nerophis lumbriciformis TaxID=546530 RepID=UPI002ADF96F4|nr:uncharacterized protein si:ch211-286b4.4 [Nerophis lumbriciformis]
MMRPVSIRVSSYYDSTALLGAVLRSVEALLYKLNGSTWQTLILHPPDATEPQMRRIQTCDTSTTMVSSMDLTKTEAPSHLHSTGPCLSDVDLSKLVCLTPLYKTLQDIQQSLQNFPPDHPVQPLPNGICDSSQEDLEVRLIPSALDSLPPRHSAVFLFGCRVMELLEKSSAMFPSVLLMPAKSVPFWRCDNSLLSQCSGDFYFDAGRQVLFLSEAKLEHAGHFIATILQSMAFIASSGIPDRSFTRALHEAMSALSLQLFNLSFKQTTAEGTLGEEFLDLRVAKETRFSEHLLAARLETYKYCMLEQLIGNLKVNLIEDTEAACGTRVEVEEEMDRLNEAFLELSMQLHSRARKDGEDQFVRAAQPSLGRNGTMLLELERHYVSQRLNHLQITLDRIRQQQGSSSRSSDGVRGRTHARTAAASQKGQEMNVRDTSCSTPAGSSQGQQTAESRGLDKCDLESSISAQLND